MNKNLDLFLTFMKIGAFTFGGGYAMLPLIQSEVERHGWLTQAEVGGRGEVLCEVLQKPCR